VVKKAEVKTYAHYIPNLTRYLTTALPLDAYVQFCLLCAWGSTVNPNRHSYTCLPCLWTPLWWCWGSADMLRSVSRWFSFRMCVINTYYLRGICLHWLPHWYVRCLYCYCF